MYWFPRLSDRAAHDEMLIFYHFVKIPELKKLVQDVSNRVKKPEFLTRNCLRGL